jgi:dolichol-phosphate mannosyltransferase
MDADFSHPTNKIHELYEIIKNNKADLAIGSRYVKGGKIIGWNFKRKLMSRVAVALFKPFSNVKDPMTGFFLIKKSCLNGKLSPRGFRLLVEILIKCKIKRIKEIPITFINRKEGKSKAGFNEILGYLYKLVESIPYKKNLFVEFFKFAFVGAIGTIVNLLVLYLLTEFVHVYYILSAIFAFVVAATHNFILNKLWTFKERLEDNFSKKYVQFFSVCLISLIVNLFFLYIFTEIFGIYYLISQVLAIGIALFINFTGNKIWTFAK